MVVLYGPNERQAHDLAAAISPRYRTFTTTRLAAFLRSTPTATCSIIALPPGCGIDLSHLRRGSPISPFLPLILVVDDDIEELRRSAALGPDVVVWWHEARYELDQAIRRAVRARLLGRIAAVIERNGELPRPLAEALVVAYRSTGPVVSVSALAGQVGVTRRRLEALWRRTVHEPRHRLKDYVDWALLLRVRLALDSGAAYRELPSVIGRTKRTLDRMARRLLDTTLVGVKRMAVSELIDAFEQSVLSPIGCVLRSQPDLAP